ncbi:efflux RND transporter periplasmic adaptor subunit [Gemmobacter sp.]|uniref:efflux RND transporter periplasmic adaptor subunit n=1 Tax=Gemmobacter sp. TaxID=1898957 RepID=UPI00391C12E0
MPEHSSPQAMPAQSGAQPDKTTLPSVVAAPRPASPGRRGPARRLWLWAGAGLFGAAAGLALILQPWAPRAVPVAVETAALAPATRVLAVNGRIAAEHSVGVRPLVSGRIARVQVAEGDTVRPGDELVQIDASAPQAALRQAVAGLDAALVAQAQAQATLERSRALGPNVARTTLETAEAAARTAAQEVARMTALVDQAQIQLANFTVRAPMAGTVLSLNAAPGQSVDPSTLLMTLADLGRLVVETDVDEAYATQIREDMPAVLQLVGETATRAGRVRLVSQRVDAATGGLAVKLAFDAPVTAPVGLTVAVNIVIERRDAALTVPRAALRTEDGRPGVLVVTDGVARLRPVSVIDWPAPRLIVTEGLVPGDVVIRDATGIADGQPVRVEQP